MIRSQLVQKLHSKNPNLEYSVVEKGSKLLLEKVVNSLTSGDRVEIRGFGTFSLRRLKAHVARNPKSGEKISVGDRFTLYFRAGKMLKEQVDKSAQKNV